MNEAIEERFLNFQPETLEAIREYQSSKDPALVSSIVNGIIEKYLPEHLRGTTLNSELALNAFGLESLTLMEVILDIQDALGLTLSDAELRSLGNLEEATALLSEKVSALRAEGPTED